MPSIRHPLTFSATPASYPLPPPGLDEHGEEVRAWLAAPSRPGPNDMSQAAAKPATRR